MDRRTPVFATSVALAVVLAATGGRPIAQGDDLVMTKAETVGMSSARLARIHDFIQGYMDRGEITGAVTLVARHGKVVHFEAQGLRYREENAPMAKDTIFSLMSMTKPIVSTALMMLWEDGRFLLDDPIAKWLPAYAGQQVLDPVSGARGPAVRPVTVRHVLTHTSGLSLSPPGTSGPRADGESPASAPQQASAPAAAPAPAAPRERPRTLQEAVDRAAGYPLAFQPGDHWQYGSSTDYVAVLVEKMTGMTIDRFTRERIFQPLGMRDTSYNVPREKVNRVAAVYRPGPNGTLTLLRKPEFREPTTYFPGVAGMNGTAADYFRFSQMLLNGGEFGGQRLLGRMTVNLMFSNQIGSGKNVYVRGPGWGFGLGAGVLTDPATAQDGLSPGTWSWGGADGTLFYIDPREDLVALLMVQLNPYRDSEIRPRFSNVVSQAIVDSTADQKPRVIGYDTPK